EVWQHFLQQLKPLAQNLAPRINGEPSNVPAGARQTGDKLGTDRVETCYDDRDGCGRLHGRNRARIDPGGNYDVHAESDQVCGEGRQRFELAVGEAVLNDDILADAVAKAPQAVLERFNEMKRLLPG